MFFLFSFKFFFKINQTICFFLFNYSGHFFFFFNYRLRFFECFSVSLKHMPYESKPAMQTCSLCPSWPGCWAPQGSSRRKLSSRTLQSGTEGEPTVPRARLSTLQCHTPA